MQDTCLMHIFIYVYRCARDIIYCVNFLNKHNDLEYFIWVNSINGILRVLIGHNLNLKLLEINKS